MLRIVKRDLPYILLFAAGSWAEVGSIRTAFADTLQFSDGGMVSGKELKASQSDHIRFQTTDGVILELARTKGSVVPTGPLAATYEKSAIAKDDSLESHKQLAKETFDHQRSVAEAHFERITELDPADKANWAKLGYREDEYGRFRRGSSIQAGLGLVRDYDRSGWTTPHARAIAEVEHLQRKKKSEIEKEIDRSFKNLGKPGKPGVEASNFLNTLQDPLAIEDIYKRLLKDLKSGGKGEPFMTILARMPGTSASGQFIELAMNYPDQNIVDYCNELLLRSEISRENAFQAYLSALRNKDTKADPKKKDRAGSNLEHFGDPRSIPDLIDNLTSKLKVTVQAGGGSSFSPSGGVSQSTARTLTSENILQHQSVLKTLQSLTRENFGFDIGAWRYWYASNYSDSNLNLRRDE
jgi:hypothetical protein